MKIKFLEKLKDNLIPKKYKIYIENIYIFFLGVLSSFGLPPYNFWIINFLTFSLLIIFLIKNKNNNPKLFLLYGFIFGFGYFVSSLYWIPIALLHDQNFKVLIPFSLILIPAFLGLFYSIAFFVFKLYLKPEKVFVNILVFSLVLGFFDFIRGNIFSGFPWNLFAYAFSESIAFIQIVSLIGIYSFNTILITIFSVPSILYLSRKKNELLGLLITITIAILVYGYGVFKINNFKNLKAEPLDAEIRILSTKIPIERFYSSIDNEGILFKLIELSKPSKNEDTIFIWPEGIIPNTNLKLLKSEYDFLFTRFFSEKHKIILGINDIELKKEKKYFYNSLSIIDSKANIIYKYHKNNLVPFGEFLPFEKILKKIGLKNLTNNYQSYTASSERNIFKVSQNSKISILPLICYEIIYSGKLSNKKNYNFIVNISEDGWFGDSIGPYQHFAHSIFRSVEYGKYTFRSANNGISAIIDPTGLVVEKLDIKNEGIISIKETVSVDKTFFSTFENKIYFLIILLFIFLIFSFTKLKNE